MISILIFTIFQTHALEAPELLGKVFNEYKIDCEDKNDCPEAMGQIIAAVPRDNAIGFITMDCTAFLIEEDRVMTNAHCIPKIFRSNEISCKDWLKLTFPKTATRDKSQANCSEIIYSSDKGSALDDEDSIATKSDLNLYDYAIVKLDRKLDRKPFPLQASPKLSTYTAKQYSVSSGGGLVTSIIIANECQVQAGLSSTPAKASQLFYYDCPLESGMSGSPLTFDGGVIAIAHTSFTRDSLREDNAFQVGKIEISDSAYESQNLANEIQCLNHGLETYGLYRADLCEAKVQASFVSFIEMVNDLDQIVVANLKDYKNDLPQGIQFKVTDPDPSRPYLNLVDVHCIENSIDDLDMQLSLPKFETHTYYNQYLNPKYEIDTSSLNAELQTSNGQYQITYSLENESFSLSGELLSCSENVTAKDSDILFYPNDL